MTTNPARGLRVSWRPYLHRPSSSVAAYAAEGRPHGPSEIIFLCQIIALLVGGRVMGELMQRVGQPAVMGQLIAGILLGPSVLGAFWPAVRRPRCSSIRPNAPSCSWSASSRRRSRRHQRRSNANSATSNRRPKTGRRSRGRKR